MGKGASAVSLIDEAETIIAKLALTGGIPMRRVAVWSIFGVILLWVGAAVAAPPQLMGEYAFTGEASCVVSFTGFNSDQTTKDGRFVVSFNVQGISTFNGDGTGTFQGRSVSTFNPVPPFVSVPVGASSSDFQGSRTYIVAPDGTFTSELNGPLTGQILTGPRAGQTFTVDQLPLKGFISRNGQTLTMATDVPTVETVTYSNGNVEYRICHRSRVLIWQGQ